MILTCPNCGTQYVVKDGAIPPQGRQVRCASCKHSWHQDPEESVPADTAAEVRQLPSSAEQTEQPEPEETIAEATLIEPRSGPEAEQRAYEEAVVEDQGETAAPQQAPSLSHDEREREAAELAAERRAQTLSSDINGMGAAESSFAPDWREPPEPEATDDEFSPFPVAGEAEPKRRSPVVTILMVVIAVAVLAALFYFFAPPEWKMRLGLGTDTASQLALVVTHRERQPLASGNELLTVTGRVINPTAREQVVPKMEAELRSRSGKLVYSWTIDPPARTLAAGASAPFNSAEVNVPPGGDELTITLGEQS
jgi:predicted Zn finger-like uncharacterized protein